MEATGLMGEIRVPGGIMVNEETDRITIMVGKEEGPRIQRTIGMIFPNSGLLIQETGSGVNVWGDASSVDEVRELLGGKIVTNLEKAIRNYKRAMKKANGDPSDKQAVIKCAWVNDLIVLASKKDWY
jgi:hypothetical protein